MADKSKPDEKADTTRWSPENIDRFPGRRLGSFFANRAYFLMGQPTTRVVFGESLVGEEDVTWYTAVTMPTEAWVDLAQSILRIHAEAERESELEVQRIVEDAEADGKK